MTKSVKRPVVPSQDLSSVVGKSCAAQIKNFFCEPMYGTPSKRCQSHHWSTHDVSKEINCWWNFPLSHVFVRNTANRATLDTSQAKLVLRKEHENFEERRNGAVTWSAANCLLNYRYGVQRSMSWTEGRTIRFLIGVVNDFENKFPACQTRGTKTNSCRTKWLHI